MELLKKNLEKCSDEIHYEEYKMAPKAFTHFTKTVSASIIASIAAGCFCKYADTSKLGNFGKFLKKPAVPHALVAVTTLAGLGITAAEFLFYKEFCDVFYKKKTARNLVATRKATEETKKRIVISGHVDSAYEWRHTYYGKGKGMTPIMMG